MYALVENLWNTLDAAGKDKWRLTCRVPTLSGRDLFGRVNTGNLHRYARWVKEPPAIQPHGWHFSEYPGGVAVPAKLWPWWFCPVQIRNATFSASLCMRRFGDEVRPTLAAAYAAAYASVDSQPWLPCTLDFPTHWVVWEKQGAQFRVRVMQKWAEFRWPGRREQIWRWAEARYAAIALPNIESPAGWFGDRLISRQIGDPGWRSLDGRPYPRGDWYVRRVEDKQGWPHLPLASAEDDASGWECAYPRLWWEARG
jgi:hypothetical protein